MEAESLSKLSIRSFNSISVIDFTIGYGSGYRRDAIPATALLGMMLLLRLFALLLQRHELFHFG